jgi:hypothetical protein
MSKRYSIDQDIISRSGRSGIIIGKREYLKFGCCSRPITFSFDFSDKDQCFLSRVPS